MTHRIQRRHHWARPTCPSREKGGGGNCICSQLFGPGSTCFIFTLLSKSSGTNRSSYRQRSTCNALVTFFDQIDESRISWYQRNTCFQSSLSSLIFFKLDTSSAIRRVKEIIYITGSFVKSFSG